MENKHRQALLLFIAGIISSFFTAIVLIIHIFSNFDFLMLVIVLYLFTVVMFFNMIGVLIEPDKYKKKTSISDSLNNLYLENKDNEY